MNDRLAKSDAKIILKIRKKHHFIVMSRNHEIYIDYFKNSLRIDKNPDQETAKLRFSNALEYCLKTGECTMVPKVTDNDVELFDFSRGYASSKYW